VQSEQTILYEYRMIRKESRLLLAILALALALPVSAFQKGRLSQKQVTQLVTLGTPDEVIAQEIRDRGLDFEPTSKIMEDLQKRKAGQRTIAALREFIRLGTIEIQAQPGSDVTVDELSRGAVDAHGLMVIPNLPVGPHQLIVRKQDYQESRITLELGNREYKQVPIQLVWAGGFISVRADPPGSAIDIDGLGQFKDAAAEIPAPTGSYAITATHRGMKPEHQNITIVGGQHAAVEFHLNLDPDYLKSKVIDAQAELATDAGTAIQLANEVLSLDSNNAEARGLVATGYFQAQDVPNFKTSFVEAIRRGASVRITLLHVHGGFAKKYLHPFAMTITATTIAFDPQSSGAPCNVAPFTTALTKLQEIDVRNGNGTTLLRLKVLEPSSSKAASLDFTAPGSHWDIPQGQIVLGPGGPPITSPSNAHELLQAVASALHDALQAKP